MAEKLYLIRINLETFLGPMTAQEVRKAYKRMDFGLQDEIAGSNRDWVAFDDLARVRRLYPELFELVKKDMLAGWGKTEHGVPKTATESATPVRVQNSSSGWARFAMAMILLAAGAGTFHFVRANGELAGRLMLPGGDPLLAKAEGAFDEENPQRFDVFMEKSLPEITATFKSRKDAIDDWLPYLRSYAFRRTGRIEGVDPRYLRGVGRLFAPRDCSLDSWKARWKTSQEEWDEFLDGRSMPSKDWSRILLWDPEWIHARSPQRGWINPTSYYEACLTMASRGLAEAGIDATHAEKKNVIAARLEWLVRQLSDTTGGSEFSMAGGLWVLSCLESAENLENVQECHAAVTLKGDWQKVVSQRVVLSKLRLLAQGRQVKASQMDLFRALTDEVKMTDVLTGFDYAPEHRFYQQIIVGNGKIAPARGSLRVRYPDVSFEP